MPVKITLKEVRESRGLSQNKLAQATDMTLQNVQKIEYGKAKSLTLEALDRLCNALNCQPGDLLRYIADEKDKLLQENPHDCSQTSGRIAGKAAKLIKDEDPEVRSVSASALSQAPKKHRRIAGDNR